MAEILRVIQPISNQKLIRRIETNELRFKLQSFGDPFVQERTYLERPRFPLLQYSHETIQSAPRINDVLDQKNVRPFQLGFGVVNELDGTARDRAICVTRRDQKIDLKRARYLSYEITQENEASF